MNLFYKIRKNARIFAFLYFQMRLHTTYVSYIRFISAYQHFKCIREYDPHFWLSVCEPDEAGHETAFASLFEHRKLDQVVYSLRYLPD